MKLHLSLVNYKQSGYSIYLPNSDWKSRRRITKTYKGIKKSGASFLKPLPQAYHLARKVETQMKAMVAPGTIFEELGLNYIGPIDGHNLKELKDVISNLKEFEGPQFLHIITKKGAGYAPAESSVDKYHGVSKFDVASGKQHKGKSNAPSYTSIFGQTLVKEATADEKIVAVTAAMPSGTGLNIFQDSFPGRTFDVGIAEQHAVTFCAGMAAGGLKPFCAIYSTFLQRGYDQIVHDVALQKLPVRFAIDRAGIVGAYLSLIHI